MFALYRNKQPPPAKTKQTFRLHSLIIENSTYNSRRSTSSCLSEQDKLRATWIAGSLAPITRLHFQRYKERMIMIVALCYLQRMES